MKKKRLTHTVPQQRSPLTAEQIEELEEDAREFQYILSHFLLFGHNELNRTPLELRHRLIAVNDELDLLLYNWQQVTLLVTSVAL